MPTQVKSKSKLKKSAQRTPKHESNGQVKPRKKAQIDPKNLEAIEFLESFSNATPEEIQEQKETWEFLKKALDEDRLSPDRPLFPSNGDNSS